MKGMRWIYVLLWKKEYAKILSEKARFRIASEAPGRQVGSHAAVPLGAPYRRIYRRTAAEPASTAAPFHPLHIWTPAHSPRRLLPAGDQAKLFLLSMGLLRQVTFDGSLLIGLGKTSSELHCRWEPFLLKLPSSLSPCMGFVGFRCLFLLPCPFPSPGCPPQISCTSISAVPSSASRIQTGPQRHT